MGWWYVDEDVVGACPCVGSSECWSSGGIGVECAPEVCTGAREQTESALLVLGCVPWAQGVGRVSQQIGVWVWVWSSQYAVVVVVVVVVRIVRDFSDVVGVGIVDVVVPASQGTGLHKVAV